MHSFYILIFLGILAGHYRNKQETIEKERGKRDQGGTQTRVNLKGLLLNILLSVENGYVFTSRSQPNNISTIFHIPKLV